MYHSTENRQISFDDFFQPAGLHMNPNYHGQNTRKSILIFLRMIRRLETSPSLSEWRLAH